VQVGRHLALAIAAAVTLSSAAAAHHSFASFFDPRKLVTIKGRVTQFAFTNPHGIITLSVPGGGGPAREWRVETNAPVILLRRGWSRDAVKPGEVVTIEGWQSRDGRAYLRLRRAMRADGTVIGVPFGQGDS
jgi:hypothetical protein